MNLSDDTAMEVVEPLHRRVDIEAAAQRRIDTDIVQTVVFRCIHDGVPFVHTTVHVARHITDAPDLMERTVGTSTIIGLPPADRPGQFQRMAA